MRLEGKREQSNLVSLPKMKQAVQIVHDQSRKTTNRSRHRRQKKNFLMQKQVQHVSVQGLDQGKALGDFKLDESERAYGPSHRDLSTGRY